jgi:hypothetical protein
MDEGSLLSPIDRDTDRWQLLRDVAVFQLKLVIDALRDAALVPLSLAAALVDLVSGSTSSKALFYDCAALGRRSERWIHLFEIADRMRPERGWLPTRRTGSMDDVVARLEDLLVEQHARGGVTTRAKEAIDRVLDTVTTGGPRDPES